MYSPLPLSLPGLKSVEDPGAWVPEVAGICAETDMGVELCGVAYSQGGLQRSLWPQLVPINGVLRLAERDK